VEPSLNDLPEHLSPVPAVPVVSLLVERMASVSLTQAVQMVSVLRPVLELP